MVKCKKCDEVLKDLSKFCHACGEKIKHPDKKQRKLSFKHPLILVITGIILLGAIFTLAAPTKTHTYYVDVPYEASESYTEKEPYDAQEAYQVQVPYESTETYTDTVPVEVDVPYTDYEEKVYHAESGHYYPDVSSPCRCTDYNFWGNCVEQTCTTPVTKYKTETQQQTIEKTRPVTKYKTETKYRTVTKYRDVQKSRTVTKTKEEPKQYEVNWLFKFRVPWRLHIPH